MTDQEVLKPKKRRRGHGEGAIYRRQSDGRWTSAIQLGWEDGKRKRKVVYGKTRAEVSQKLAKLLSQKQQGLPIQTAGTTLASFLDEWLEDTVKNSVRPRTYDSYKSISKNHLIPSLGKHKLLDLTQQHVKAMMKAKRESGSSERNIAYMRVVLRIALNEAMKLDLVHRNVATLVRAPTYDDYEAQALDLDEAIRFVNKATRDRLGAMYGVTVTFGPRQSEVFGLRWSDIDFGNDLIHVRYQVRRVNGKVVFAPVKSRRSRRAVPAPKPVMAWLKAHRKAQLQERLLAGADWQDYDLVFCTQFGTPLDGSNVRKQFKAILAEAKLPDIRFHDLRHSATSILAAMGVPQRTVMEILGHSQMSTTNDVYTHVPSAGMREAMDKMEALFNTDKQSS